MAPALMHVVHQVALGDLRGGRAAARFVHAYGSDVPVGVGKGRGIIVDVVIARLVTDDALTYASRPVGGRSCPITAESQVENDVVCPKVGTDVAVGADKVGIRRTPMRRVDLV